MCALFKQIKKEKRNMSNSELVKYTNITKNKSNGRGGKSISRIIIHHWGGVIATAKQGVDYFKTTKRQVSSNYVIGNDGSIGLSVDECDRPWTTGGSVIDNPSITIEVSNAETKNWTVSDKAYQSLINLIADICKRNNIEKLEVGKNLYGHRDFSATACPGDYLYGKMNDIAEKVNNKIKPPVVVASTPQDYVVIVGGAVDIQHAIWIQERLQKKGEQAYISQIGDIDGDGKVTIADARIILNKSINK